MVSKASDDLPDPRQPGNHGQLIAGDIDVDVAQVVLTGAADLDFMLHRLFLAFRGFAQTTKNIGVPRPRKGIKKA